MKHYDFIVGFTTFYPGGFKTRYLHFNDLKVAKMFSNNKNLKNTSKIYVDLEYYEELENINNQNIQEIKELKSRNQGKTEALEEWNNGERVSIHCVHKNKIKARIEELKEYLYKGNIKDDFLMIRIKAKIQELQKFLENEK